MMPKQLKAGFSIVELMVVVAIIVLVASIGVALMGTSIQRNQVFNQLKYVRSSFMKAKANAIEFTAPVRLTIDSEGAILAVRDANRNGDFADEPVLVIGKSATEGEPSSFSQVLPDPSHGGQDLPLWFQEGEFSGHKVTTFTDGGLVILSSGRVTDYSLNPKSGTFFFKSKDGETFGAVHITSMGEVKLAHLIKGGEGEGAFNGWKWFE